MNKKNNTVNNWDKVWVISGDPCLCRFATESALEEYGNPSTVRYDRTDSPADLKAAFSAFAFTDPADAIILTDPNAEMLRICLDAVTGGIFRVSALLIVTPGGTLDGRQAFASTAQKQDRVYYLAPIEATSSIGIKKHLKDWVDNIEVKVLPDTLTWLAQNAPTRHGNIKTATGKKEAIVFDLMRLEAELSKAMVVAQSENRAISVNDVSTLCKFEQTADTWSFVDSAIKGDTVKILSFFDKLAITQTNQGALWLLVSQYEFLINLKSLLDLGIRNNVELQKKLSLGDRLGFYLKDNWEPLEEIPTTPAVNPYRIQMAIPNCNSTTVEKLVEQYVATVSAIRDIRSGLSLKIVLPYLAVALSGQVKYEVPLYDIY